MSNWEMVARQMLHPTQVRIVELLDGGRVASPSDLARAMGYDRPTNVMHHVKQLRRNGVVELVRETRHRGGMEHFYQLRGAS